MEYEYKCIAAPEKARRRRGAKTRTDRVALAIQDILAAECKGGWEYLRADLIPVEEKSGFFSRAQDVHRAILVFRRAVGGSGAAVPYPVAAPVIPQPAVPQPAAPEPGRTPDYMQQAAPETPPEPKSEFRLAVEREEAPQPAPDSSGRLRAPKGLG